jgi:2-iminobutanoate/2-iminopropanoate deaminase
MIDSIVTKDAPAAIGPYSQAIRAGDFLFVSGQIPLDPSTGSLVEGGVVDQAHRVLKNLGAILNAAGGSYSRVVKTTVYLADMADFAAVNEVYASYFPSPAPARATIQAARLPRDVRVEIDLVAYLKS